MDQKSVKGGFAKVRVASDNQEIRISGAVRGRYLKLGYPNGVSLILPVDIDPVLLGRYIRAID